MDEVGGSVEVEAEQNINEQSRQPGGEEESGISFNPPVYRQRYAVVGEMIKKFDAKKVLDFGCAEGKLLRYLIRNDNFKLEQLVGVDIDGQLLRENCFRIEPLLCDWLETRDTPFTVSMFQGSISQGDDRFCDYDLISCIEIIEHLIPEHLEHMPAVIFGQLSPKVVVVTTPNSEFNILFPNLEGFRHWDHKFEWTRKEFQEWATTQANKYGYSVSFQGIGPGPDGTEHLGCCSQMALFERKDSILMPKESHQLGQSYELIKTVDYPYRKNTISQEQKIIYEVERLLWFLSQPTGYDSDHNDDDGDDNGDDDRPKSYELPELFKMGKLKELCGTIEKLRSVLDASSLSLSSDGKSVLYSLPKWDSNNSDDDDSSGWDDVNNGNKPSNNDVLDGRISPVEDWDAEENIEGRKENVCWNDTVRTSIYWDGRDNTDVEDIAAELHSYCSGNDDEDCHTDVKPWSLTNWYDGQSNDVDNDNDDCLDDCASGDDNLPWIVSNSDQC